MKHRPFRSIRANKRVLIATITVVLVATLVAIVAGNTGHKVRSASADGGGTGTAQGSTAQCPPDLRERHPGGSQPRDGAPAALPRGGAWPEGVVRPPGCLGRW